MEGCLRCSGRAVPYSGGGVTPVTLTPNFEFPITAQDLVGKTMTASTPVTMGDLINGLKFYTGSSDGFGIVERSGQYFIYIDPDEMNSVSLSSDGLTITFGGEVPSGLIYTSFTFNE